MKDQKQLLNVVYSDLCYIRDEWNEVIEDDKLRRDSTVLRRLLVDGDLLRVWNITGFHEQPKINSPSLSAITAFLNRYNIGLSHLKFACSGSGPLRGGRVETPFFIDLKLSDDQVSELYQEGRSIVSQRLTKYLNAPCIYANGIPIRREELIKFVSNKLGGAHFDSRRRKDKLLEKKFMNLDDIRSNYEILEKDFIFYELLSIGYHIIQSEDIKRLIVRIDDLSQ